MKTNQGNHGSIGHRTGAWALPVAYASGLAYLYSIANIWQVNETMNNYHIICTTIIFDTSSVITIEYAILLCAH